MVNENFCIRKIERLVFVLGSLLVLFVPNSVCRAAEIVSAAEWLIEQTPPKFRPGHTLPRLTRFGWVLPIEARKVLAAKWGYALEFGGYADKSTVERALREPDSIEAKVVELVRREPETYKLAVILSREMPSKDEAGAWVHGKDGALINPASPIWSPAASDAALTSLAKLRAEALASLASVVKPNIVLNGGEYGIGVIGQSLEYWRLDPSILTSKKNRQWFDYISRMKAREQETVFQAIKDVVPGEFTYIYYTSGGGSHRGRDWNWRDWTYDYSQMQAIGTYPSDEYYFRHFNDGWERPLVRLPGQKGDLLTQALNAKGAEIAAGNLFTYDWICGGWQRDDRVTEVSPQNFNEAAIVDRNAGYLSRIDLYKGFLRSLYVAGTIGANSGYYAYPQGGFEKEFRREELPHWLLQLTTLSRVHALFSYLESFVRNSRLIEGTSRHAWGEFPAYELPTGDRNLRVLARKHNIHPAWLLVAWSATGDIKKASIDIPGRGTVDITGDATAKLYLIDTRASGLPEEITEDSVQAVVSRYNDLFN